MKVYCFDRFSPKIQKYSNCMLLILIYWQLINKAKPYTFMSRCHNKKSKCVIYRKAYWLRGLIISEKIARDCCMYVLFIDI